MKKISTKKGILFPLILLLTACQTASYKTGEVEEFMNTLKNDPKIILVDVRTLEEHNTECIPGTQHHIDVLKDDFSEIVDHTLPQASKVAIYCRSGRRSKKAAEILYEKGYCVIELGSGFNGWKAWNQKLSKD